MKPTRYASRFAPLLLSTLMALSTGNCLITAPMLDEALLGGSLNLSNAADDVQAQDATLLAAAVVAASSGPAVISVSPSNLTFASGGCGPAIDQTVTITNLGAGGPGSNHPFHIDGRRELFSCPAGADVGRRRREHNGHSDIQPGRQYVVGHTDHHVQCSQQPRQHSNLGYGFLLRRNRVAGTAKNLREALTKRPPVSGSLQ